MVLGLVSMVTPLHLSMSFSLSASEDQGEDEEEEEQILSDMPWLRRRRKRAVRAHIPFFCLFFFLVSQSVYTL